MRQAFVPTLLICLFAFGPTQKLGANIITHNWSGYAVQTTSPTDSFTSVSGSWTVPTVSPTAANTYSGIWIGFDGLTTGTVEQIGILANYLATAGAPEYYAFY